MNYAGQPTHEVASHHLGGMVPGDSLPSHHGYRFGGPPPYNPSLSSMQQYPHPVLYGPQPMLSADIKKKAIRAVQACETCRQRKAKCDEGKPKCSYCDDNNLECGYRETPVPKRDRYLLDLTGKIDNMLDLMTGLTKRMGHVERRAAGNQQLSTISETDALPSPQVTSLSTQSDLGDEYVEESENFAATGQADEPAPNATVRARTTQVPLTLESTGLGDHNEVERVRDDSLSIPLGHSTAAHKLMKTWPSITPFFQDVIRPNQEDYVMEGEMARGLLSLYGRGEAHDRFDRSRSPSEVVNSPKRNAASPVPSHAEGDCGVGFVLSSNVAIRKLEYNSMGGLNPNGTLKLDVHTVNRYFESFMKHMHIMHPILDKGRIGRMVKTFCYLYGPVPSALRAPFAVVKSMGTETAGAGHKATKRKRSTDSMPAVSGITSDAPVMLLNAFPERSISNAIVLLVLALGNICEHKTPLPSLAGEQPIASNNTQGLTVTDTSQLSVEQSQTGPSPPGQNLLQSLNSETTSQYVSGGHSVMGNPSKIKATGPRNVDKIPGLAYYAYATDILGNLHGGNDLSHTQAFLLAGLYAGQLARVNESWTWIHSACRACQILVRPTNLEKEKNPRKDLIVMAFWTCLQLESDIRAELDFPDSGIANHEYLMNSKSPSSVEGRSDHDSSSMAPDSAVMLYYSAQLYLRKVLNRVHSLLYHQSQKWSAKVAAALATDLAEWRKSLPPLLQWEDSDPPAEEINAARMRAKYWGAMYVIYRPFLHHAIHTQVSLQGSTAVRDPFPIFSVRGKGREEHAGKSTSGIHAANSDVRYPKTIQQTNSQQQIIREWERECKICVDAAMQSTVSFDSVRKFGRPLVTNIFGTAHAQWGNILVLSATYFSPLSYLVSFEKLQDLLERTINFFRPMAHLSPSFQKDLEVLENTQLIVMKKKPYVLMGPRTPASSFSEH